MKGQLCSWAIGLAAAGRALLSDPRDWAGVGKELGGARGRFPLPTRARVSRLRGLLAAGPRRSRQGLLAMQHGYGPGARVWCG